MLQLICKWEIATLKKKGKVLKMTETQELILNKLGELCRIYPQQRLGQIIYNYILRYCPNNDCFFIEDTKLLELLETIIEEIKEK